MKDIHRSIFAFFLGIIPFLSYLLPPFSDSSLYYLCIFFLYLYYFSCFFHIFCSQTSLSIFRLIEQDNLSSFEWNQKSNDNNSNSNNDDDDDDDEIGFGKPMPHDELAGGEIN